MSRTLTPSELALAYELRQSQTPWKIIAIGLGVSHATLRAYIKRTEREGIAWLTR